MKAVIKQEKVSGPVSVKILDENEREVAQFQCSEAIVLPPQNSMIYEDLPRLDTINIFKLAYMAYLMKDHARIIREVYEKAPDWN